MTDIEAIKKSTRLDLELIKDRVRDIPVSLIIPQSDFLADQRFFYFIGILKVAAELGKNSNPVGVVDLSGFRNEDTRDIITQHLKDFPSEIFGITATTPHLPAAVRVLNVIKELKPNSRVILGGTHATLAYAGFSQDRKKGRIGRGTNAFEQINNLFDRVVVGDGEMAVFPAIDPDSNEKVIEAGERSSALFIKRQEPGDFSWPARHLIDEDSYHYEIDGRRAFSVISQLGCPFECGFCGGRNIDFLRMTRTRSSDNVVAEVEDVVRRSIERGNPYQGVMFYDDELNVVPNELENLCRGLVDLQDRLGMEMRFRGFVKAELFTREQARLMYRAGFRVLLSGVESGSDYILKVIRKKTTGVTNSRCLGFAHEAGLKFKALMSIGHPDESEATINQSVEWVLRNKPDDVDWTVITPYPGSLYFDEGVYNDQGDDWVYTEPKTGARLFSRGMDFAKEAIFYKGVPGEYTCQVSTPYLTADQLVDLRDRAETETRNALKLDPIPSAEALQFEHSMGQNLPSNIFRSNI